MREITLFIIDRAGTTASKKPKSAVGRIKLTSADIGLLEVPGYPERQAIVAAGINPADAPAINVG
ncbi:MAG: hypothetical protein ACU84Q_13960 [Gammaproteobacteria bacterium]